jgi:hypothetical protein
VPTKRGPSYPTKEAQVAHKKKKKKKKRLKLPIFFLSWPFVGSLFGICGIVSNPCPFQPIVGLLAHSWPYRFWSLWYCLKLRPGLCGIVSNPGLFQPIVGFYIWPLAHYLYFGICGFAHAHFSL